MSSPMTRNMTRANASHVARSNTAQIGCRSQANSRITELCASYV